MCNDFALMLRFGNFKSRRPHTLHTCECEHACPRTGPQLTLCPIWSSWMNWLMKYLTLPRRLNPCWKNLSFDCCLLWPTLFSNCRGCVIFNRFSSANEFPHNIKERWLDFRMFFTLVPSSNKRAKSLTCTCFRKLNCCILMHTVKISSSQ